MKKIFNLLLLIFLFSNVAYSHQEKYYIDASALNIRKEPNAKSDILIKANKNQEITVIEETDIYDKIDNIIAPWIKVKLGEIEGYAFGGYIVRKIIFDNNSFLSRNIFKTTGSHYKSKAIVIKSEVFIKEYPSEKSSNVLPISNGTYIETILQLWTKHSLNEKQFWYYINYNNKNGFISSKDILIDAMTINGNVYGTNEYPVSMTNPEEHRYIQTNSEVKVFSIKTKSIIQSIVMPDQTDNLKIVYDGRFKKYIKNPYIIIQHIWNHFTCCPIGYVGNIIYSLDSDGKIDKKLFSWFTSIGAQDEPNAQLKSTNFSENSLSLKYEYYDSIGLPDLGYGYLTLIYSIDKDQFIYKNIESRVLKTHEFKNGSYSSDDEHKLTKPIILKFDKDILNNKFEYMSKIYQFIN